MRSPGRVPPLARLVVALVAAGLVLSGCMDGRSNRSPAAGTATPRSAAPSSGASPGASDSATWAARAAAPLALTEVAAAAHDGRIWVAGGLDAAGRAVDRVMVYDPAADAWSDGPALPEPIHHSALASDGEQLWLVGGYTGDGFSRPTDAVRRLDGEAWTTDAPLPEARGAGAAVWDGARLVYAGGVGPGGVSPVVFARSADGAWAEVARLFAPREHLAVASDGSGNAFVLGGRRGGMAGNVATVEVVVGSEVRRGPDLPTPRGGVGAFFWPSLGACLIGGESVGGTNPEVECVTADGEIVVLPPLGSPRHGLGAAVVDGVAYVLLGGPEPGLFVSDAVEALELP